MNTNDLISKFQSSSITSQLIDYENLTKLLYSVNIRDEDESTLNNLFTAVWNHQPIISTQTNYEYNVNNHETKFDSSSIATATSGTNEEKFQQDEIHEKKITYFWEAIRAFISLPELNASVVSQLPVFTQDFISSIFADVIKLACTYDLPPQRLIPKQTDSNNQTNEWSVVYQLSVIRSSKSGLRLSRYIICFLHWLYRHIHHHRAFIRQQIGHYLLLIGHNAGFRKEAGAGPSRAHVLPLLEFLQCILSGLTRVNAIPTATMGTVTATNASINDSDASVESFDTGNSQQHLQSHSQYLSLFTLLQQVLIPLHQPNEFVEWRSQVPVIQDYHPALVRCILTMIQKDSSLLPYFLQVMLYTGSHNNSHNSSQGHYQQHQQQQQQLMSSSSSSIWPNKNSANHIKDLLLIEELESLLKLCTPSDMIVTTDSSSSSSVATITHNNITSINNINTTTNSIHQSLVDVICQLCGEGTEHIRVIQRALLMLKNPHVLSLLFPFIASTAAVGCCDSTNTTDTINTSSTTSTASHFISSYNTANSQQLVIMQRLIRVLYRRGIKSWNPTVNRMTAAVLIALQEWSPREVECAAESVIVGVGKKLTSAAVEVAAASTSNDCNLTDGTSTDSSVNATVTSSVTSKMLPRATINVTRTTTTTTPVALLPPKKPTTSSFSSSSSAAATSSSLFPKPVSISSVVSGSAASGETNTSTTTTPTALGIVIPYTTIRPQSGAVGISSFPPSSLLPPSPWQTLRNNRSKSSSNNTINSSISNNQSTIASMTVTGVAPWANKNNNSKISANSNNTTAVTPSNTANATSCESMVPSSSLLSSPPSTVELSSSSPLEMLLKYIDDCRGVVKKKKTMTSNSNDKMMIDNNDRSDNGREDIDDEDEDQVMTTKSWNILQQSVSPILLPDLKFHDLVFGHDLGSGAFSTVRYARHILKDKLRIAWPEYAVKIVSANKIQQQQYLFNVEREMTILKCLTHPGIARLVSSFRYKESAYMVLEYACGGDLHSYIIHHQHHSGSGGNSGSTVGLSELSTRFIISEVAVTLAAIHDLGFIYFDLKPENILITASGHVKLTDFGGARAYSKEAKQMLREQQQHRGRVLKELRNGDWKDSGELVEDKDHNIDNKDDVTAETIIRTTATATPMMTVQENNDNDNIGGSVDYDNDNNQCLEGTPGYLAPEALLWNGGGSDNTDSGVDKNNNKGSADVVVVDVDIDTDNAGLYATADTKVKQQSSSSSESHSSSTSTTTTIGVKADAWSLGCLTYFCIHGRPLYFGDRADVLQAIFNNGNNYAKNYTVSFNNDTGNDEYDGTYSYTNSNKRRVQFQSSSSSSSSSVEKEVDSIDVSTEVSTTNTTTNSSNSFHEASFISALLERDVSLRMSIIQAVHHPFLILGTSNTKNDSSNDNSIKLDPLTLHSSPPPAEAALHVNKSTSSSSSCNNSSTATATGDEWKRRQLSVLIAPLPNSSEYNSSNNSSSRFINTNNTSRMLYGVRLYSLTEIEETVVERGSRFI